MSESKIANTDMYYDYKILPREDAIYVGFYELDDELHRFFDRNSDGKDYTRGRIQSGNYFKEHPHYKLHYTMRWYKFPGFNLSPDKIITDATTRLATSYIKVVLDNRLQPNADYPLSSAKTKYNHDVLTIEKPMPEAMKELELRSHDARARLLKEIETPEEHYLR